MRERLDLESRLESYAPLRWSGRTRGQTLFLDDVSAIPFLVDIEGVEEYQHRARTRARTGDLFAAVTQPSPGYEAYCRDVLGLGSPELVIAEPTDGPLAVARACAHGRAFEEIVRHVNDAGSLLVHPYMSIESVWELARKTHEACGAPVEVIGPPPPVTWIANDKKLFSELVASVLGDEWVVETHTTDDPCKLARFLVDVSHRCKRVALKRTRCASSMGNQVYASDEIREAGPENTEAVVRDFLRRTEWEGNEEVLVVAWENATVSPSTQLWIPPLQLAPPQLDGIYVQILKGPEQIFVGSRPSPLPDRVNQAIGDAALRVGAALQQLGYVGRCSFDHLVLGDLDGDFRIVFTECNGRWGGTSTPMHLVERLVGHPRPPYRAQDFIDERLVGATFEDILGRVGDAVFDPRSGRGRYVFYNIGPLREHGKLDVIAFGDTQEAAEEALEEELPRLLGL